MSSFAHTDITTGEGSYWVRDGSMTDDEWVVAHLEIDEESFQTLRFDGTSYYTTPRQIGEVGPKLPAPRPDN